MSRRSRGFTLLELLLVLVIAGLAAALVPPLFGRVLPTLTLKSETRDLSQVFSELRNAAITQGKQTAVVFFPERRSYQLYGIPGESDLSPDTVIQADGKAVQLDSGEGVAILFNPDGSSSGGSVQLSNGHRAYRVAVNWLTGVPTIGIVEI